MAKEEHHVQKRKKKDYFIERLSYKKESSSCIKKLFYNIILESLFSKKMIGYNVLNFLDIISFSSLLIFFFLYLWSI